ncbi:hypothetical protein GF325_05095, partial [Candidatus Bathyarchaeota archaeon]|nr:hypothetical protein [Candidatus Bathyarchaeota archaeon]
MDEILIAGDTHGNITSTTRIFTAFGEIQEGAIIFLGDYVDRGEHSLCNLLFILSMKLLHPTRVFMLRGNHEDVTINNMYGFTRELRSSFKDQGNATGILNYCKKLYNHLSLAARTPAGSICLHGSIPRA